MEFARAASLLAKCTRRKCGAAIFGADKRIVSTGRNGSAAGLPHCTDGACPRGRHYALTLEQELERAGIAPGTYSGDISFTRPLVCNCGQPHPCPDYIQPYEPYEKGPGLCIAVHAEANAIIYADYHRLPGSTIYITDAPCHNCTLLILAAGIREVVIP
jgi:dCMP deaminase